MATSDNEYYWRIYLLHHEGSSLISKQVISREVEKCGEDIDNILLKNKQQLDKVVTSSEADILFPKSKKTDTEQWETDLFPRVILTLFSKTLPQTERQHIRGIQNVQKEIADLPEPSLEPEVYDDLTESLLKALREFARVLSKETETKLNELVDVFINKPFNAADMLNTITKFNLPKDKQQKLAVFLDSLISVSAGNTGVDEFEGTRDQPKVPTDTQLDLGNKHKHERKTGDSDSKCHGSDDGTLSDNLDDAIVQNVGLGLTEDDVKDWDETQLEEGIKRKSFDKSAKDKLEKWEDEVVKVAVIGRAGTGKSLFINAFRRCSKTDPSYAKVGPAETTATVECYTHPNNNKLQLYDIPGMGTKNFPKETYIEDERINFNSYDIYLIMSTDRFTEEDEFIAMALEKLGKVFLFVRTRVDINLEDDDEQTVIDTIRADCKKKLDNMRIKSKDVYLISSRNTNHPLLDWGRLVERLVDSLTGLKKDALMFSLQFQTRRFIEDKRKSLRKRALKAGAKSAAGGAVPVPGVSFAVDVYLICNELDFYRKTLGITENDLIDLAQQTNKNVDQLKRKYKLKTFDLCMLTAKEVTIKKAGPILTRIAASEAVETSLKLLPFIGSAAGAAISSVTTVCFLRSNLNLMVEDAHKMMEILVKETGDTILSSE